MVGFARNLEWVDGDCWDKDMGQWIHVCPACSRVFHSSRRDAVTCSGKCRTWLSRYKRWLYNPKPAKTGKAMRREATRAKLTLQDGLL